jgi:hypothetical protein
MKTKTRKNFFVAMLIGLLFSLTHIDAQDTVTNKKSMAAELAKQLTNPVADLSTLEFGNSWDFGYGSANSMSYTASLKLIYPIHLSKKWNLITRSSLPFIYLESPVAGGSNKWGLGDGSMSLFFSPAKPINGWVFGGGPIIQIPTATEPAFGGGKLDVGPTAAALRQYGPWTYGLLVNHVWSLAGTETRSVVNATEIFPFLSYSNKKQVTFTVQAESFYDWAGHHWIIPIEFQIAKLLMLGKQPVEFLLAARKYTAVPDDGADWGLSFNITFIFPKRSLRQ